MQITGTGADQPNLRLRHSCSQLVAGRQLVVRDFVGPRFDVDGDELARRAGRQVRTDVALVDRVGTGGGFLFAVTRLDSGHVQFYQARSSGTMRAGGSVSIADCGLRIEKTNDGLLSYHSPLT